MSSGFRLLGGGMDDVRWCGANACRAHVLACEVPASMKFIFEVRAQACVIVLVRMRGLMLCACTKV